MSKLNSAVVITVLLLGGLIALRWPRVPDNYVWVDSESESISDTLKMRLRMQEPFQVVIEHGIHKLPPVEEVGNGVRFSFGHAASIRSADVVTFQSRYHPLRDKHVINFVVERGQVLTLRGDGKSIDVPAWTCDTAASTAWSSMSGSWVKAIGGENLATISGPRDHAERLSLRVVTGEETENSPRN